MLGTCLSGAVLWINPGIFPLNDAAVVAKGAGGTCSLTRNRGENGRQVCFCGFKGENTTRPGRLFFNNQYYFKLSDAIPTVKYSHGVY